MIMIIWEKISEGDELMEEYVSDAMNAASDEMILESLDLEESKYEGENKAHLEDAKRMLVEDLDVKLISRVTELPIEEIKNLK